MLYQSTCVGLEYGLCGGYFQGLLRCQSNPIRIDNSYNPSLTHWPTNINVVPIDYGFRPRLRGRLTLRRLALRRNPWIFGGRVSHSSLATHVSILASDISRIPRGFPFTDLQNAPLPLLRARSFGAWLEPRYIFAARPLLDQ